MNRLATAFKLDDSIRTKEFELGGFKFNVRVPLDKELEDITKRFLSPPDALVNARMEKMKVLLDGQDIDETELNKDNIVSVLRMEAKITEFVRLLVPQEGDISDITYEEISAEFPLQVQLELLTKITEVIQPGYKDARKN